VHHPLFMVVFNGMKRVLKAVCFVAACTISFIMISILFRPVTNSRMNICGYYAEEENSLDMVYVGGSAAYVYWAPLEAFREYGFTSFNFASDSMTPQVIKYCMIEALKTQKPEVFLVDLRPFQYGDATNSEAGALDMDDEVALRNTIDQFRYSKNRYDMIEASVRNRDERIFYHFDICKYHSRIYSFFDMQSWKYLDNKEKHPFKGFSFVAKTEPIDYVDRTYATEELPLSEEMDTIFIDLLEFCKEEDLQVLFVVHSYMIQEDHQQKYNYMERVIKEYGFDYLNVNDFSDEIGYDYNKDFFNMNHVNIFGAEKYTSFLGNYLQEKYSLPDKRNEQKYQEWNDLYDEWSKEKQNTKEVINEL